MPRYIDADDLFTKDGIRNIGKAFDEASASGTLRKKHKIEELVNAVPTADVAPVIHAHYIYKNFDDYECSNCHVHCHVESVCTIYNNYCPNCGAKMDDGEKDD